MYKYNNNNSIVRAKDILPLLGKFSIDEIESNLVKIFINEHNLTTRNDFLLNILKRSNEKTTNEIKSYLDLKDIELTLKNLERIFELLIEEKDRKLNGVYYTPKFIVDYIVKKTITKNATVCDPACGSGAFLVEAIKRLSELSKKSIIEIIENNIFGVDILERSIKRSKIILTLLALQNDEDKKEIKFNLKVADSLSLNWQREFPEVFKNGGFMTVIGNPPYVRTKNLPEELRKKIQKRWLTASNGNIDLFIPFIELGINILNKNGTLGYIIPNSYFTSVTSKKLREFLQKNKYLKEIIDFNQLQLFSDVTTYTCITILDKKEKNSFNYTLVEDDSKLENFHKLKPFRIEISKLNSESWNLLNKKDYENINKIEKIGIPLGKLTRISTGVATLRNDLYIIEDAIERNGYYIKNYQGQEFKIEKNITREIIKASIVKSEDDIKNNRRRIIFPYKKVGKKYQVISESELKRNYPECYKYFLAIKSELNKRDKGKKTYDAWFAFGRSQGLMNGSNEKLLSPDISSKPRFVICKKKDVLFYVGYALSLNPSQTTLIKQPIDLEVLHKILNSKVFEYYIKKTSRHYSHGYRSYAKHFITNFSIPFFSRQEIQFLKSETNKNKINRFLVKKYGLSNL